MLYSDVSTATLQSSSEHTCTACTICSDEDCRIAVEMSAFSNKAFSWNEGYFVTNVVTVEHGRYSLSCVQKL